VAVSTEQYTPSRLKLALVGLLAGTMSGLFGVGGGLVIVPALVALCRRDQRQAVATSLLAIAPLAIAGVVGYALHREVDVWLAVPLAVGSMIGAWLGSALLRRLSLRLLRIIFAVATLGAAVRLLVDPGVPAGEVSHDPWQLAILVPIGIGVGVLAGLTGIGGGAVMVPVMQLGFAVPAALAKGTSLLVILPTALISGWHNRRAELGSMRDAGWIGLVGAAAALAASAVSVRMPGTLSDVLFGCFLLFVSVRTVWADVRGFLRRRRSAPAEPEAGGPGGP
jgi:uncharacterized protein